MPEEDLIINLTYYHVAKDVPEISPDIAVVIDVLSCLLYTSDAADED